jgi:hypothetical protein
VFCRCPTHEHDEVAQRNRTNSCAAIVRFRTDTGGCHVWWRDALILRRPRNTGETRSRQRADITHVNAPNKDTLLRVDGHVRRSAEKPGPRHDLPRVRGRFLRRPAAESRSLPQKPRVQGKLPGRRQDEACAQGKRAGADKVNLPGRRAQWVAVGAKRVAAGLGGLRAKPGGLRRRGFLLCAQSCSTRRLSLRMPRPERGRSPARHPRQRPHRFTHTDTAMRAMPGPTSLHCTQKHLRPVARTRCTSHTPARPHHARWCVLPPLHQHPSPHDCDDFCQG